MVMVKKQTKKEREIGPIIEMNEAILNDNRELAERNHRFLSQLHIKSIDIVGSIGSGKTSILEKVAEWVHGKKRLFVICGDITTTIDSDRIHAHGAETFQINTGRACALNAYDIQQVLKDKIPHIENLDILIIENVGNLICPSDFILGTDRRIVIMSVTEGDHVVIKHPLLVKMSDAIIINKIDLVDILGTNLSRMITDAKAINPKIEVIPLSAKTGQNFDQLMKFLELE
jgi:hydrogenase nickel incorporation protein HypB